MDIGPYRRSRARRVVALFVVLVGAWIARRTSRHQSSSDEPETVQAPATLPKYVPTTTEGLGASVAILIDNSGSMKERAGGDARPKYLVARQALETMLSTTDSFVARQPDFPVNVGLYQFASGVLALVPVKPYNRAELQTALASMPFPDGGTAIGSAMDAARADLYRAGTIRKYILVVTDGENTEGRSPSKVAREINARSEGAVRMFFVAFDVAASRFDFLRDVRGEVLEARNGFALQASLDTLYRSRILAESMDAGETLPDARRPDSSRVSSPSPSRPRKPPQ